MAKAGKAFRAVTAALFGITLAAVVAGAPLYGHFNRDVTDSAVKIVLLEDGRPVANGSGVYLGSNFVLTAAHVVDDTDLKPTINKLPAEVLWANTTYDIALVQVQGKLPRTLRSRDLACRAPVVGEPITVSGWPLDVNQVTFFGHVLSKVDRKTYRDWWNEYFITDVAGAPGHSGSAALDSGGRIIGVFVGVLGPAVQRYGNADASVTVTDLNVMIPSSTVCKLLGK